MRALLRQISFTVASGAFFGAVAGSFYVVWNLFFILGYWDWKLFFYGLGWYALFGALLGTSLGIGLVLFSILFRRTRLSDEMLASVMVSSTGFVITASIVFLELLPGRLGVGSLTGIALMGLLGLLMVAGFWILHRTLKRDPEGSWHRLVRKPGWIWAANLMIVLACFCYIPLSYGVNYARDLSHSYELRGHRKELPDILLIVLDTLRYDHLSCYGYERETTPFIDSLSSTGVLFTQAISTSCHTPPAHASLFTGYYPSRHGVRNDNRYLPRDLPLLTERLSGQGYFNAGVVSNFVLHGYFGWNRGFDSYDDALVDYHFVGSYWMRTGLLSKISQKYSKPIILLLSEIAKRGKELDIATYTTDHIVEAVRRVPENQPLFLFANYIDPHLPYDPPPEYRRLFLPSDTSSYRAIRQADIRKILSRRENHGEDQTISEEYSEEIARMRGVYDGEINYLDHQLERLFDSLEETGRLNNALVIIVSDHGEQFGEHGLFTHANSLYEALTRIPLIISWPGTIPPGVYTQYASLASIPSTILDAAGLAVPDDMDERSLLPELIRGGSEEGRVVISQWQDSQAVYRGRWKGIIQPDKSAELYDVESDVNEMNDLAMERPDSLAVMVDLLRQKSTMDSSMVAGPDDPQQPLPQVILNQIRALGYVN